MRNRRVIKIGENNYTIALLKADVIDIDDINLLMIRSERDFTDEEKEGAVELGK